MTRRTVTKEEVGVLYRYGSLRILRDGQIRLSPRTLLDVPELDFSANYVAEMENSGCYIFDTEDYVIYARAPWNSSFFLLYLAEGRIVSACFDFGLDPDELRKAVDLLRRAGGGLERWIAPGLEYTRDTLAMIARRPEFRGIEAGNPRLRRIIPKLLTSVADLPVAEQWKRHRRDRERR